MRVTETTLKVQMKDYFGNVAESHICFDDFARVGSFLSDGSRVKTFIGQLETNLQVRLNQRITSMKLLGLEEPDSPYTTSAQTFFSEYQQRQQGKPYKTSTKFYFKHLLTEELDSKQGVNKTILVGNIGAQKFLNLVGASRHWKDPGAGKAHGEFSHRIQWYLVDIAGITHALTRDVFSGVAAVYVGDLATTNYFALWDFLVDRNPAAGEFKPNGDDDFRSPEKLNLWITNTSQSATYPLLHSFLHHRMAKRESYNLLDYVAKKYYGAKSFAALENNVLTKDKATKILREIGTLAGIYPDAK